MPTLYNEFRTETPTQVSFTREMPAADGDDISRNATNAASAVAADVTKMADDDDGGGGGGVGQDGATAQIVKISDL